MNTTPEILIIAKAMSLNCRYLNETIPVINASVSLKKGVRKKKFIVGNLKINELSVPQILNHPDRVGCIINGTSGH